MKIIKILLSFLVLFILIWICIPARYPVKFHAFSRDIKFDIAPLKIDTKVFGVQLKKEFVTKLGLDLKGGSHLVFQTDTSKVKKEDLQDSLNSVRDVIERRVNFYGVSEPVVQTVKAGQDYRISVDLPGVTNVEEAVGLIGRTAELTFREEGDSKELPPEATQSAALLSFLKLSKETGLTGRDIKKATVEFDPQTSAPQVGLKFSPKGTELFSQITERNIGKQVGIFLDGYPISIPTVQAAITDGNAVINGSFKLDEAKKLAVAINSGALPLPVRLVSQQAIGPSLGASEIQKSIIAGIVGLAAVMIFMVIYYGRLGIIACGALMIYGLISFSIFRGIPITLTLPGIAGFILSIGMAVDSNILIFERIKEELRGGQDLDNAIRLGFGRAIDAIKDANITTLIVAFILFNPLNWEFLPQFGLIKGFALTLAIGVATSLFTGVVITKRLINIFYTYSRDEKLKK